MGVGRARLNCLASSSVSQLAVGRCVLERKAVSARGRQNQRRGDSWPAQCQKFVSGVRHRCGHTASLRFASARGSSPAALCSGRGAPLDPPGALLGQASAEAPLMPKRCSRTTLRAKQGAHGCPLLRGAAWREGLGAWMTVPWSQGL